MNDALKDLIAQGPDPRRGLQGLVLSRFHDIRAARMNLRRWAEIAEALGMPDRAPALAASFSRVAERIKEGKLVPPSGPRQARKGRRIT